ncbi:hypothetical protein ABZ626_24400 [Streptomyces longispororuber]|uniref:hypothetical protein n=1 Tax=Streptomyces longispororuber TaxID=68230 RepID=UPI0033CBF699
MGGEEEAANPPAESTTSTDESATPADDSTTPPDNPATPADDSATSADRSATPASKTTAPADTSKDATDELVATAEELFEPESPEGAEESGASGSARPGDDAAGPVLGKLMGSRDRQRRKKG